MICYGVNAMYFYCGIVATLLAELIVLAIWAAVLKRKTKRMKKELEKNVVDLDGLKKGP